jgi:hypothetical protein
VSAQDNDHQGTSMVWRWREQEAAENHDGRRSAGKRPFIQLAVLLTVALLMFFVFHKAWLGCVALGLGSIVFVLAIFCPAAYGGLDRFGRGLGHAVGIGLTWILLVPFFYLCFTAGRIILLMLRRDPMQRSFTSEGTYWLPYSMNTDPNKYRKQYSTRVPTRSESTGGE